MIDDFIYRQIVTREELIYHLKKIRGQHFHNKDESLRLPTRIETPELSLEGHLQAFHRDGFVLMNAYVPYANTGLAGATEYRKKWDNGFREFIRYTSMDKPIIICGDMNVVHAAKDTFESRLE